MVMMKIAAAALPWIAVFAGLGEAQVTWPSAIDELEDVMFLNTGYRSRGFSVPITPCSFSSFGPGRQTAAEWLRVGFHDMSTTNVFNPPHGGIDGSLAFELNSGENIGAGLASTFTTYGEFYNSRLPVSDLVALGVYASVRSCGGPVIPMRGGRVDAGAAGALGVPQPQNGQGTFINQFARMGFNTTDMIAMVACGHSMGGVHAGNFPNIVAPGTAPNDFQLFDNTPQFDNNIATRYINGPDTDPLAVGISVQATRNADFAVFTADKNVTLQALTNAATFNSRCSDILQRMIEVVDPAIVSLSPIIQPYEVKPAGLQLTLLSGGAQLTFSGNIRVRTTVRPASQISNVHVVIQDHNGAAAGTISTTVAGTAAGFDNTFTFYSFSSNLPITTSISSFTVTITGSGGVVQTYNNNGVGFPVSDSVIVQTPQSCLNGGNLTVMAAVRSTISTPVNLSVTQKVAPSGGSPVPSPLPSLVNGIVAMVPGVSIGPYKIYSASIAVASAAGAKYGVSSGDFADAFKDVSDLGATCATLGATGASSTTTSASSTSSSAAPTLGIKQRIGAYKFQGCYTEGYNIRALDGAAFVNYTTMTLDICASNCAGFSYWGVEYYGECYCGNTINNGSVLAPSQSDCSFICPGSSYEYCGAGDRLEMYGLASLPSSTTSISSTKATSSANKSSTSSAASSITSVISSSSKSTVSSAAPTGTLSVKQTVAGYTFQGCYTEATNVRALTGAATYGYTTMTLEICASNCVGFTYWAVEYGGECYCGNQLNNGSVLAPLSDCNTVCPGNPYEYCGSGNRLELYGPAIGLSSSKASNSVASTSKSTSDFVPSSSKPSTTSSPSTTKSTSITTSKPLSSSPSSSKTTSSPSTTKSTSITTSKPLSSSPSSSKTTTSTNKASTTNPSSTKSTTTTTSISSSTLQTSTKPFSTITSLSSSKSSTVQTSPAASSKATTTSSTSPTSTGPYIHPTIGVYTYYGCQTEGTNSRALSAAVSYNYTAMTLDMCAQSCAAYTYWGVEYYGECYCGNVFSAGSVSVPESDCNFLCPGDQTEWCGAGNRLSTYVKK